MSIPLDLSPSPAQPPVLAGLGTPPEAVVLKLDHAAALVVFDMLARMMDRHDADGVRDLLEHPGEIAALWSLMSAFEQALDEPKDADYRELIRAARERVVANLGAGS
ncbi:hypothetical protein [Azorhizobium caulinodans]|jgi:hypothetical protein|uniref:hypothetical protein n=1 Tax=Azorhizobium caulinodans TaxID=7 RepID=UPI002FBE6EC9